MPVAIPVQFNGAVAFMIAGSFSVPAGFSQTDFHLKIHLLQNPDACRYLTFQEFYRVEAFEDMSIIQHGFTNMTF